MPGRTGLAEAPRRGAWAEMADRVQRMLRKLDQADREEQQHLLDVYRALKHNWPMLPESIRKDLAK